MSVAPLYAYTNSLRNVLKLNVLKLMMLFGNEHRL